MTFTAKIWWDASDQENPTWAWTTYIDGSYDKHGWFNALDADTDEELIKAFRAQVDLKIPLPDSAIVIE